MKTRLMWDKSSLSEADIVSGVHCMINKGAWLDCSQKEMVRD